MSGFFNMSASTYAYISYQDIKHVDSLRDQTVIVVKAPTDTKLEVPDPDEVRADAQEHRNTVSLPVISELKCPQSVLLKFFLALSLVLESCSQMLL